MVDILPRSGAQPAGEVVLGDKSTQPSAPHPSAHGCKAHKSQRHCPEPYLHQRAPAGGLDVARSWDGQENTGHPAPIESESTPIGQVQVFGAFWEITGRKCCGNEFSC